MRKLWGGAFASESDPIAARFGQSIDTDLEFWREDVEGSIAHAEMLAAQGILSQEDGEAIVSGLQRILEEGPESLPSDVEDIHTAVEARLQELIGEAAGRLHTARSRNDQVAVDTRLWLRRRLTHMVVELKELQGALLALAEKHEETLLPGQTHQQHAQPISLAFHFLAHFWALQRHGFRVECLRRIIETSPLGSAALAGTPFPIDRQQTAAALGFAAPSPNALDATSDRSYVLDAQHLCASVMIDLSRVSQELILWATPEFGFVRLPDSLTTGSSIMPQKRNPDMAELIRGRTGRVIGHWTALAATMKGLPLGYNRDTQEDKPPLFDSFGVTLDSLALTRAMLSGAEFRPGRMKSALRGDFSTATDLADALAESGMPFREAHEATGRVVRLCQAEGIGLEDLTLEMLQKAAPTATEETLQRLMPEASLARRESYGGTGPKAVAVQIEEARLTLSDPGYAGPSIPPEPLPSRTPRIQKKAKP